MNCSDMDSDMYEIEMMAGEDETEPQPSEDVATASEPKAAADDRAQAAEAAPAPENTLQAPQLQQAQQTPLLQLTAGNAGETDAVPTPKQNEAPARASSGKASQAADAGKSNVADEAAESKPGITFAGKAVIDRFEGKWAVLLVGDDEKSVSVPKKSLPRRVQVGQWLNVQLGGEEGDEVVSAKVDPEETARMRKRIMDKLALLRSGGYLTEGTDEKPPQS